MAVYLHKRKAKIQLIPESMIPISALAAPVEVLTEPQLKTDEAGAPKKNPHFPGRLGYSLRVEAILGYREKKIPSGEIFTMPETRAFPVTIWAEGAVEATIGDYFYLQNCAAGVYQGAAYLWADDLIPAGEGA